MRHLFHSRPSFEHLYLGHSKEDHIEDLHLINYSTSIRNFDGSVDSVDLFHACKLWTKTSVHAEYFFVYNCSHWQTIKTVNKGSPEFDVVSSLACIIGLVTFIIEAVHSIDSGALMISS